MIQPTEPDTAMAAGMARMHPRALASAASAGLVPSPPWGIGSAETGDAREPLPSGKSAVAPGAPERRADGWPLCPVCGEDELWSPLTWLAPGPPPTIPEYEAAGLTCYLCGWKSPPPTCGEIDPLSTAVCNRKAGHGFVHRAVDDGFEFGWTSD